MDTSEPASLIAMAGFNKSLGFRLVDWSETHAVLEVTVRPDLLNRSEILHGGVVATLIDAAGGFAGGYTGKPGTGRLVLTLSLTTSFIGQTSGGVVRATARKRGGGRRIFASTIEVTDEAGQIIAVGEGTYRYRDDSTTGQQNDHGQRAT